MLGSKTAPRSRGALLVKAASRSTISTAPGSRVMPRHRLVGRAGARGHAAAHPAIVAAGTYYDAKVARPERLVLELVLDGLAASPRSAALNYTSLTAATGGTLDLRHPRRRHARRPPEARRERRRPLDRSVNAALGAPSRMIGGTKGSHILLDHPELVPPSPGG